jgi:hypothetical protein
VFPDKVDAHRVKPSRVRQRRASNQATVKIKGCEAGRLCRAWPHLAVREGHFPQVRELNGDLDFEAGYRHLAFWLE